jgi:hypothetical protein
MPPWGVDNSGACNTFRDARWLSEEEIGHVVRWTDGGAPEGEPAEPSEAIKPRAAAPIAPSLSLDAGADYHPPATRSDDYRCFIVDPELDQDRFLAAFEVVPGDPRIVHHVILFTIDSDAAERRAADLAAADPEPGYTCFGSSLLPARDSRWVAGWAPGTPPTRYPPGTGIRLARGHRLVIQVHYNVREGSGGGQTRLDLELAPSVEKRAEILPLADLGLQVPPGQALVYSEPFEVAIPGIGAFIRGVFPHMHELGRKLHARIVHADGSATCLAEVPAWDFQWQQSYFFTEPLYVLSSDRIEVRCGYDTRSRTEPVRWGEGTEDEMCLLGLFTTLN